MTHYADLLAAATDVADWWDTTHGNGFEHDPHCQLGWGDDPDVPGDPDVCTCGWAKAAPALALLSILTSTTGES